jgi:hypothetical protein
LAASSLLLQVIGAIPGDLHQNLTASRFGITLDELKPLTTPIETFLTLVIVAIVAYSMLFTRARNRTWVDQLVKTPKARDQWVLAISAFVLLAFYTWIFLQTIRDIAYPRQIGPIAVLLYALGLWQLVASLLFVFLPSRLGLPSLALVPILIFAYLSNQNDNHSIDAKMRLPAAASQVNETSPRRLMRFRLR